jgi:uncharacterized phiE125 gp8 family phage protein
VSVYDTAVLPITRPVRATEPTALQEPIDLAQAKHHCKLPPEVTINDQQLQQLIVSARRIVEADYATVCYTGSFTWQQSCFPSRDFMLLPDVRPVTAITSIVYTATDGTSTTWSSAEYGLHSGASTPHIGLKYGYVWPVPRGDINGITITYVAGFASVAVLPEEIRQAVKLQTNIQWNDYLEMDTAKMRTAYENHVRNTRRSWYA